MAERESHSFDVELATILGLNEAIILSHIKFLQKNFAKDGEPFWLLPIKRTVKKLNEIYPYLSEKEIRGALDRLEKNEYLLSDINNENNFDRTKSYVLGWAAIELFCINTGQNDLTKGQMLNDSSLVSINDNSVSGEVEQPKTVALTPLKENERSTQKQSVPRRRAEKKEPHTPKDVFELLNKDPKHGDFFRDVWKIWEDYLEHRKEMKVKAYASAKSESLAVIRFYEMAGGSKDTAQKIVNQSRANQWAGLFGLKDQSKANAPQPQPTITTPKIPVYR